MKNEFLDIDDRQSDYNLIYRQTFRAELGIRSIGLTYHDHSSDEKSFENVFILKDNIEYRLFSAAHQYRMFLQGLDYAEKFLQEKEKENIGVIYPMGNPYFNQMENELSSIFDSIIFHLSSVFDYLSHAICYMYFTNKQDTLYWTKLVKKARGDMKGSFDMCAKIDEVDRRFVGRLYDYRSRLLHNKRDKHDFEAIKLHDLSFRLKILASQTCLKHFSEVKKSNPENKKITLCYLSSWLIKQSFIEIENILDAIKIDLEKNSKFNQNLVKGGKGKMGMFIYMNPETHRAEPSSNGFWKEYKEKGFS